MSMTEAENVTARLMSPLMSGCTGSYFCSPQPRPQPFFTNKQLPSPQPPMGATILSSLFISNIPCKIREEEIVELFKDLPGYVSGRLRRTKVGNYIAFIEFDTAQNAIAARNKYNGYNFDSRTVPANSSTLPKHLIKRHGILIDFSRANASQTQSTQQQQQQQQQSYLQLGFGEGDTNIANKHFSSLFYSHFGNNEERNENEISQKLLGIDGNELATLYVEGLPCDVTKREVSHIFRHYKGFKDIRIIPKEDKTTKKTFILCFVDFETREDAGAAMKELQGYKMDLEYPEQRGLTIYFARTGKLFKH